MKLHELSSPYGATTNRKRVGRGNGSGHGTYSGRGIKGEKARTAPHIHPYFEGGQLPLSRRLPHKRGFTNIGRVDFAVVNVGVLDSLPSGLVITPDVLYAAGMISKPDLPVKLLGDGDVTTPVTVRVHRLSKSAKAKISAAGGTFEELWPQETADEGKAAAESTGEATA